MGVQTSIEIILDKKKPEDKCNSKPHPNDKYTIVDGTVYLNIELL